MIALEIKEEIKELIKLVRLDEKYEALLNDGLLPIDRLSSQYSHERKARIIELSSKYGVI